MDTRQMGLSARSAAEKAIAQWLKTYLAKLLALDDDAVDETRSFERFGLDSSAVVGMVGDLGDWLGHEIDTSSAYDHPSIRALSHALAADEALCAAAARWLDERSGDARAL